MPSQNYKIQCYDDDVLEQVNNLLVSTGDYNEKSSIEGTDLTLTDLTLNEGENVRSVLWDYVKKTRNEIAVDIWDNGKTYEAAEEDDLIEYVSLKRTDLYKEEWLGVEFEAWLDSVRDTGLWDLKEGETLTHGKKKVLIKCVEDSSSPHPDEPENSDIRLRTVKYAMTLKGAEDITFEYELCYQRYDGEEEITEHAAFFSDDDGHDNPTHNFTFNKWEKAF